MKKKIIILVIATALIVGITFLGGILVPSIENIVLKRIASISFNLCNGAVALISIKLTGIKIGIELKNYLQFVIGLGIALILSLSLAFIPAWCGHSLVGKHLDYNLGKLIYAFFFTSPCMSYSKTSSK